MPVDTAPRAATISTVGTLLIVTGPPGAGKSTVARALVDRFDPSVLVEGDAFFGFLERGAIEPWKPESHEQNVVVTEAAAIATGRFASGPYTTVYDGVVGPWFLPTFARATGLDELHYALLFPSEASCVERVANRVGHGFTDEAATRKMHAEFANAIGELDPRHVLAAPAGPDDTPDAVADAVVARLEAGALRYTVG